MNERQNIMRAECRETFNSYLERPDESPSVDIYALGRRTLESGVSLVEMADALFDVVTEAVRRAKSEAEMDRVLGTSESFMLECMSPYAMAFDGANEANRGLRSTNDRMEEQVRRVAHEIHDSSAQCLATAHTELHRAVELAPRELVPRLQRIHNLLNQVETDLRRFSSDLRPTILDDLGLVPALHELSRTFGPRAGLIIAVEGAPEKRFAPAVEIALYRTVQEALSNVGQHARAHKVKVRVEADDKEVRCSILDDGTGIAKSQGHATAGRHGVGLIGIRERLATLGGSLVLENAIDGHGTRLTASIPFGG